MGFLDPRSWRLTLECGCEVVAEDRKLAPSWFDCPRHGEQWVFSHDDAEEGRIVVENGPEIRRLETDIGLVAVREFDDDGRRYWKVCEVRRDVSRAVTWTVREEPSDAAIRERFSTDLLVRLRRRHRWRFPALLIFTEKHDARYYLARDEQELLEAAWEVFARRVHEDYWYYPPDDEPRLPKPDFPESLEGIPSSMRKQAGQAWVDYRTAVAQLEDERRAWETLREALEEQNRAQALAVLYDRRALEYEGFEIVQFDGPKSVREWQRTEARIRGARSRLQAQRAAEEDGR